jgi:hypothetical protein
VHIASAIGVQIRGLKITNSGPSAAGVLVDGTSNGVVIERSLIVSNQGDGVRFAGRSSGAARFNTVAQNAGSGLLAMNHGTWLNARDNIVVNNGPGLATGDQGQVSDDYNLVNGNSTNYRDDAGTGLAAGPNSIVGQAPAFVGGSRHLSPASPAVDAAEPQVAAPAGGGARADMGYKELVGVPLALLFGREGVSAATGNSGIAAVEVGFRKITDPTLPLTDTASLPTSWQSATLDTANQTASYWTKVITPTDGDGLYRIYSRATDQAGNTDNDGYTQFRGSFLRDSTAPVVTCFRNGRQSRPGHLGS